MPLIKITTDRLPQPDRQRGAVLDVTPEKAASMVAQGFAEIVKDVAAPKPAQPAPDAAPVAPDAVAATETPDAAETAPAAAFVARRRRRGESAA